MTLPLVATALLMSWLVQTSSGQRCPPTIEDPGNFDTSCHPCKCNGSVANCSKKKLTKIPHFDRNLTVLDLSYNPLGNMTSQDLYQTELLTLERLSLHGCKISHITSRAFHHLKKLRYLDLGMNTVSTTELGTALGHLPGARMETLCLSAMGLSNLDIKFWKKLHHLSGLKKIYLFDNNFDSFNMTPMTYMTNLTVLQLSQNYFTKGFFPAEMQSLEELTLAQCRMVTMPDFCPKGRELLPRLHSLQLSSNFIRVLKASDFGCLGELRWMNVSRNPLSKIPHSAFSRNPKLQSVTASHLLGPPSTIEKLAFNNSALQRISFTHNNLRFNQKRPDRYALSNCSNLTFLDLTGNDMSDFQDNYRHLNFFLEPLQPFVTNLIMAFCEIWEFPKSILGFQRLQYLNLSHNSISTIPEKLLVKLEHLQVLDLSYNRITTISPSAFPKRLRWQLTKIDLSGNRLNCDCDLLWLIEWSAESKNSTVWPITAETTATRHRNHTTFLHYPEQYRCAQEKLLNETGLTERKCLMSLSAKTSLITLLSFVILMLILTPLLYRFRWHLQYLVFALRYSGERLRRGRGEGGSSYTWDAYVSYDTDSSQDRGWVLRSLMPALEGQRGLRLCLQDRDFRPGALIVDNIVQCIKASRKVMVVLSKDHAASEWCQFELALTHRLSLEQREGLLVPVMLSAIPSPQVTKAIFAVLKTNAFVTWPTEEDNRQAFWNCLAESIHG